MEYLIAILIVGVLLGGYVFLKDKNEKTPVPEGCENLVPDCEACGIKDCATRVKKAKKKEGEEI